MAIGALPNAPTAQAPASASGNFVKSLQQLIVATPQGVQGINGFLFDYVGEVRSDVQTEITDHFTEDNSSIQDHIALKPLRFVLRGLVGELVLTGAAAAGIAGGLQNLLTTVPAYLGRYTPGALAKVQGAISQAQNIENQVNQAISQGKSLLNFFDKGTPAQTRQQQAFAQLRAMVQTRQIFKLVNAYGIFDNMVIETLSFVQPEETQMLSDITVNLKEMRFAQVIATPNYLSTFGGRAAFMQQAQTNVGKTPGTQVPNSIAFNLFAAGKQ